MSYSMYQVFVLTSMLASNILAHVVLENPKTFKFFVDGPTDPIFSTVDDFPRKIPHMVIHSIEGGCPARKQKGTLEGPNKDKVGGQPEYYMNCAPVTITDMKKKKKREHFADRRKSLPRPTGEALNAQIPIAFPDSGSSTEPPVVGNATSSALETAASSSTTKGIIDSTAWYIVPEPTTSSEMHPIIQPTIPTDPAIPTNFCPAPITETVTTEIIITVTATIIVILVITDTTAARPISTTASSPGVPEHAPGTCTEGQLTYLPDETHFATCTGGKLTSPQPIPPGFKCAAMEGEGLEISPAVME
ncbi:hypothetical protein LZ31DRAFT_568724 [Colletotrichum somersetense]|nr:hypothetical protein LZ31DRAFT_568724 [Colletotrichum somersetense]